MPVSGLVLFALTYFVAVATPGPGIAAVLARALGKGLKGMPAFIAGFVLGDLTLYAAAAAGFAALAGAYAPIFLAIKWGGAAYLIWLSFKLWTTAVEPSTEAWSEQGSDTPFSLFLTTYSLTLGNPKPILFFVALLPSIIDLENLTLADFVTVAVLIAFIIAGTLTAYATAAAKARQLFSSVSARRRINRITGSILAIAAVLIALG
ncbi:MAG: LysE family translocator [Alphaproteobacteria bacterium]|nr:LysE family translocator [Alphaproteobacteria bacterium]